MPGPVVADLRRQVAGLPEKRFAVVEGLRDPDLRSKLEGIMLPARPLYLPNDKGVEPWAGPILIDLAGAGAARFIEVIEIGRAAVFWGWPGDPNALHRHLRSLNMIRIPPEPREDDGSGAQDWVLFRHYDPDAIAPVLPVLEPGQRARLLGAAIRLLFAAPDYGGVVTMEPARPAAISDSGVLRLDAQQMTAIETNRQAASRLRIARFLCEEVPAARLDETAMAARVVTYAAQARSLGLETESDIARWGYLQLISNEKLYDMPVLRDSFRPEVRRRPASEYLDAVYDGIIEEFRRRG